MADNMDLDLLATLLLANKDGIYRSIVEHVASEQDDAEATMAAISHHQRLTTTSRWLPRRWAKFGWQPPARGTDPSWTTTRSGHQRRCA
jgi:hypothetical protein